MRSVVVGYLQFTSVMLPYHLVDADLIWLLRRVDHLSGDAFVDLAKAGRQGKMFDDSGPCNACRHRRVFSRTYSSKKNVVSQFDCVLIR